MSNVPPRKSDDDTLRLQRCIRDLAALSALPSMCIGSSPDAALDIVLDALPTALNMDLIYLSLPGLPAPKERATLRGKSVTQSELAQLSAALAPGGVAGVEVCGVGRLWCFDAELPMGAERGRLVAGRTSPPDPETDRVLVRSAANLVGMTLASANLLEMAQRKDDFLAMLGHELRNPLAPIVTAVELLSRNDSVARERQVIERHARHLARLVDDLLDISHTTRGGIELADERVTLCSVLERAVEIAAPVVIERGHVLSVAESGSVTIRGDSVRLAQIFGNLLINAAKFTPACGRIEVGIEELPERVRVRVRDNGRGIARDQLTRIFQPFVQADRAKSALKGGLGLGLAIVADLVKRHGGSIGVASEGLGRGATFTVELPTAAPVQAAAPSVEPRRSDARFGVRVLVVDDNVDIAELLSEALQYEGFETAVAHDAYAALQCWRSFVPHAAVLDVGLPELDGYELARELRAEYGPGPTLIAATGYGQPDDRFRARNAGFDRHFVKPVSVRDLVLALDESVLGARTRDHSAA